MSILLLRLIVGVLGFVALAFATQRVAMMWRIRGAKYLIAFLALSAIDQLVTCVFVVVAILEARTSPITWQLVLYLGTQCTQVLTAMAFSGFLLGVIGDDGEKE